MDRSPFKASPKPEDILKGALRVQPVLDGNLVLVALQSGDVTLMLRISETELRTATMGRHDALFLARTLSAFVETLPDRIEQIEAPEPKQHGVEGPCPQCQGHRMLVSESDPQMRRCLQCEHVWKVMAA